MDWVRPMQKIQLHVLSYQKWPERPSEPIFAQFFMPEPKLQKRAKHEFWVKADGLVASVAINSTASSFVPKVSRTALRADFRTVFIPEPKLQKDGKHEFWVKADGLGASVAKNSTASSFVPKVSRTALRAVFRTVFRTRTETPKTR